MQTGTTLSEAPTLTSQTDAVALKIGQLIAGRYRIEAVAGAGGQGLVYRALDEWLNLTVALKTLAEDASADELLLVRRITHARVVRVHDLVIDGEQRFLCMDWLPGGSLAERLSTTPPAQAEALQIALDLAQALQAAHAAGVVHQDLKPGNVLFDAAGRAVLADFGIAARRQCGAEGEGLAAGSRDYLAPEQAAGIRGDARSDWYAYGRVLHQLLMGSLPAQTEPDARSLPPGLRRLLKGLLQRAPSARLCAPDLIIAALQAPDLPPARPKLRYGLYLAGALLALLGLAFWLRWPAAQPPTATPVYALAVLPIHDQSGQAALHWTADGIAELLVEQLQGRESLRVVPALRARQALQWLGLTAQPDPREAAHLRSVLGVQALLHGRLRQLDGRWQLQLWLADALAANTDPHTVPAQTLNLTADTLHQLLGSLAQHDLQRLLPLHAGSEQRTVDHALPEAALMPAYMAAQTAAQQGRYDQACALWQQLLQQAPGYARGWLLLARCEQARGEDESARSAWDQALAQDRPAGRIAALAQAELARAGDDPVRAQALYRAWLQRTPKDAEARTELAGALAESGEYAAAEAELLVLQGQDTKDAARLYQLGRYALVQDHYRQALDDYLLPALLLQAELRDSAGQAATHNAMGVASEKLGLFAAAAEHYDAAIRLRRALDDRAGLAASLSNRAALLEIRGNSAAAETDLAEAERLLLALSDRPRLAALHNDFGVLAEERGDYVRALRHYRQALQQRRELPDRQAQAESAANVGYLAYLRGDYDSARSYLRQGLHLQQELQHADDAAATQLALAQLDSHSGRWADALRVLQDEAQAARSPEAQLTAELSLLELYRWQGRYRQAIALLTTLSARPQALADARAEQEITLARLQLLLALGRLDELAADAALQASPENAAPAHELGNLEYRARLQLLKGELALRRQSPAAARAAFATAATLGLDSAVLIGLEARLGLAHCAALEGRHAEAAGELQSLAAESQSLGDQPLRLRVLQAQAQLAMASGNKPLATKALRAALDLGARLGHYAQRLELLQLQQQLMQASGRGAAALALQREIDEESRYLAAHAPAPDLSSKQ